MADSLSPECTPLKKEYDSCFNAWFEGYLEPAVSISQLPAQQQRQTREEYSRKKAEEFQRKCGKLWEAYRGCVQKALKGKGLDKMLEQSREENAFNSMPPVIQDKAK
ncbi:hypothetical protein E1B28_009993 [Marasmius oreades]|uniref:Uncharacterized protein n=1 Tax=Marasmius oreades TaxID=181124 RepID=A0A9P7UT69_9AGAR|nr:uncharacterized protein E1B28_009993 [Marasmius oreades]KAG7090919.1 hypothetical protein E1B28_009993 [Marasmius oreades]